MYGTIIDVIDSGRFELSNIIKKIDVIWLQNDITDEEKKQLIDLAREKAKPENSYAPLNENIDELFALTKEIITNINNIDNRVKLLEGGGIPSPEPGEEYPEYKQPTGAHDAYHKDDKVTYNGNRYICIAPEGVAVVWNPDTYPAYWKKV